MFPTGPNIARLLFILLLMSAGCEPKENESSADGVPALAAAPAHVTLGVTTLLNDSLHLVSGRRVGLITNHTGKDADGAASIDLLHRSPDVDLVALYSPEHGIRGAAEAGVEIASGTDEATGLPIHSLYGDTRKPTPDMLSNVDVLLFDIQDIGARYYTYLSTMSVAMEAAGEAGIPFVVLDRPNPLGGTMQGNILEPEWSSFVGMYPVPMRHGLTAGEFARMVRNEFGVSVELHVAPVGQWSRDTPWSDTGLPWNPPSPNIPTFESALHYPGTCLFEGTSFSVGRGTDRAFEQIGAPWVDTERLVAELQALDVPDVEFVPVRFTPVEPGDGKFGGVEVAGVRLVQRGPRYDPTLAALALLVVTRAQSGADWSWRPASFDGLAGTDDLRAAVEGGATYADLVSTWGAGLPGFERRVAPYLLYP